MRVNRRGFIELTAAAASGAIPRLVVAQDDALRLVTGDSVDPQFGEPFIEVNEERNDPDPHRYVRGGFKGTAGKFSFYFPVQGRYQGRFFHNTYPLITSSDVGPSPIDFKINEGDLGFTFASGAYFVQTNQRGSGPDQGAGGFRLNAAAAKFSRVVAADIYGRRMRRPYGYIHGGSGGAFQVLTAAENSSGVWDGFLPYVHSSNYSLSSSKSVVAHARRVLSQRNRFPGIVDALDPGGSGDPYAGLNEEERGALREATLMGFPLRGWWQYQTVGAGGSSAGTAPPDPTYVEDFWSKPGYLGSDPASSVRDARINVETTIGKVTDGPPATIELAGIPDRDLTGSHFTIISGAAAGTRLPVARISGKTLTLGTIAGVTEVPGAFLPVKAPNVQPGDKVRIDNTASLALQTYHRHFLPPSPEYYGWNQFRGPDGKPLYPQRPNKPVGMGFDGHVNGKVLVMECMMDIHAWAWQADWYRSKVKAALGPKFEDNFALWFIDNAMHDVPGHFGTQGFDKAAWARTISAVGVLQQGLRDLATWCEKGIRPAETHYNVIDTQVRLPVTARERGGIQPVVTLKANGGVRADVSVNAPVTFTATIEVPPKAGQVVAVEWDFEGIGEAQTKETLRTPQSTAHVSNEHAYAKPGTYFAVLRVFSQRQGDAATPYARIQSMARVRVVVT